MCLIKDEKYPVQEDGAVRYKVVIKCDNQYISRYMGHYYELKKREEIEVKDDWLGHDTRGFHVYVNLEDARNDLEEEWLDYCIILCKCENFVAGGEWDNGWVKNEIWRTITPIKEVKSTYFDKLFWRLRKKFKNKK